jgi:lycopene beta-cyclase
MINHPNSLNEYDYIICGGGMAGLSLAYLLSYSYLSDKRILIIDKEKKTKNDRTWAFWQNKKSKFDTILIKKWDSISFTNVQNNETIYPLKYYHYKLLRGIDFYNHVYSRISNFPNIHFLYEKIKKIKDFDKDKVEVSTETQVLYAQYAFDSTFPLDLINPKNYNLLQHFKGFVIETENSVFNAKIPQMMNFSVPQKPAEGRFMYILPFSENKALVEFTVFSQSLLSLKEYNAQIENFLKEKFGDIDFKISEEEFGVIPMSNVKINANPSKRIIRIGTSGGHTNPATGYTFANTQKKLEKLIDLLEQGKPLKIKHSLFHTRHSLYASTLLNVIIKNRHSLADVFDRMFSKNPIESVFRFLDNESNFWEELKIMYSTPKRKFFLAMLDAVKDYLKS